MTDPHRSSDVEDELRRQGLGGFDEVYVGTPPWDIGRPQPALAGVELRGRVLDAGCGTGEHALIAAERGFDATGVDLSPRAIERAKRKAEERHLVARFLVGDVLELAALGEQFGTVLDCGVFHVFSDDSRSHYVASLGSVLSSGGRVVVLCFSEHQAGEGGPRRVTQAELRAAFASGWTVEEIIAARLHWTLDADGAAAWRATVRRT